MAKTGTLKWRCDNCGEVETTSDEATALAESGPPMCPECADREMSPCETDLQPVLDALSRCAFVLLKVTEGDQQALGNAVEVVQASVKLLAEYGEQAEWTGETEGVEESNRWIIISTDGEESVIGTLYTTKEKAIKDAEDLRCSGIDCFVRGMVV